MMVCVASRSLTLMVMCCSSAGQGNGLPSEPACARLASRTEYVAEVRGSAILAINARTMHARIKPAHDDSVEVENAFRGPDGLSQQPCRTTVSDSPTATFWQYAE